MLVPTASTHVQNRNAPFLGCHAFAEESVYSIYVLALLQCRWMTLWRGCDKEDCALRRNDWSFRLERNVSM